MVAGSGGAVAAKSCSTHSGHCCSQQPPPPPCCWKPAAGELPARHGQANRAAHVGLKSTRRPYSRTTEATESKHEQHIVLLQPAHIVYRMVESLTPSRTARVSAHAPASLKTPRDDCSFVKAHERCPPCRRLIDLDKKSGCARTEKGSRGGGRGVRERCSVNVLFYRLSLFPVLARACMEVFRHCSSAYLTTLYCG